MKKNRDIEVLDTRVTISRMAEEDYISLTDIARHRDADRSDDLIRNWVRNRNTLEFLGIWEKIHNPNFNSVEFDGFRMQAGLNSFTLTPKQWITRTNAKGIVSKAGRYGGTFAHRDIAFEFASWISPCVRKDVASCRNKNASFLSYRLITKDTCISIRYGIIRMQFASSPFYTGKPLFPGRLAPVFMTRLAWIAGLPFQFGWSVLSGTFSISGRKPSRLDTSCWYF